MSQIYNNIEIAVETPRKRGVLIKKDDLKKYLSKERPLYRSMYLYNLDAVDFADSNNNSLRGYYGPRNIDNVLIDIDKEQNTNEKTPNFY